MCLRVPQRNQLQRRCHDSSGAALIIVLAFVVLLTGLVVAFFTRSVYERQISNGSVNQVKADTMMQGAVDTILGDLRQEIADSNNSRAYSITTGAVTTTLYVPKNAINMVPSLSGTTAGSTYPTNLIKRSAFNAPFYSGGSNTPPSRAINVSSTTPALNSHYISPARWNAHFLLPKKNPAQDTDFTPVTTGSGAFTPPDWVLVRKNENPSSPATTFSNTLNISGSNPVVGRYAYAIYDEGGLLDMTAAGYPSIQTTPYYKDTLSFADLKQLPGIGVSYQGVPTPGAATQDKIIDNLVGFRNYGAAAYDSTTGNLSMLGGIFPNLSWSNQNAANYYRFVRSYNNGFIKAANVPLGPGSARATDHQFVTRQELMQTLLQYMISNSSDRANLQNALQYMGTFSRELNQPSYVPVQSTNSNSPGYNASAPKILAADQGGNNASGLDDQINPAFLMARAKTAFARNDGSTAITGEPLVIKRFALSRLAWLTCKGPSAPRASSTDADITALKNAGFTTEWLQQGTDANILKYFGLQWTTATTTLPSGEKVPGNFWKYVHGRNGSNGAILRLNSPADSNDVVRAGREADFFELLKATIKAGSIAKVGSSVPKSGPNIPNLSNQYLFDYSVDYAIIQIGANIIDQFDSDNYPTRILFDDGSNQTAFSGIENLPYLYRVHPAVVKTRAPQVVSDPKPDGTNAVYYGTGDTLTNPQIITNTGQGDTILIPEIWNPHDWCGDNATQTQIDQTQGTIGPNSFEIYATSDIPAVVEAANYFGNTSDFNGGNKNSSPGFQNWSGVPRLINESNSKMIFNIPSGQNGVQLFREPTVLYIPNKPTYCNLSAPGLSTALVAKIGDGPPFTTGTANPDSGPPIVGQSYIGMYLGSVPLIWSKAATSGTATTVYRANVVVLGDNTGGTTTPNDPGVLFTFNLQCTDAFGNLVTYDKKQVTVGHKGAGWGRIARPMHAPWAGLLQPRRDGDREYFVLDPRTSRFGFQYGSPEKGDGDPNGQLTWSFPPFSKDHLAINMSNNAAAGRPVAPVDAAWLSRSEGIMGSRRNGWGNGAPVQAIDDNQAWHGLNPFNFPRSMGFYPGNHSENGGIWTWDKSELACYPGLFAENDGAPLYNDQIVGDVQWYAGRQSGLNYTQTQYYADPDGVVRRGMGGWTDARFEFIGPAGPGNAWQGAYGNTAGGKSSFAALTGLPMRVAHQVGADNKLHKADVLLNYPPSSGASANLLQAEARPIILNRPFRSVAELGYTFSGTPWKNLNLDMPESGDTALLDVFCVNDSDDSHSLIAGRVNLNTRQVPVLKAILNGAYKNEWKLSGASTPSEALASGTLADILAQRLVARTSGIVPAGVVVTGTGARPLQNISELVGKWVSGKTVGLNNPGAASTPGPYGPASYDGYSSDLINPIYFTSWTNKTPITDSTDDPNASWVVDLDKAISRRRAAPIRALANAGQTRIWNLMIDVVAQSGRYPQTATTPDKFMVEGEQRYWVHVAIDRYTGDIVDKQIEVVRE